MGADARFAQRPRRLAVRARLRRPPAGFVSAVVEASAGVILRPDGSFLLGRRPPGKVYAGWWEFPGGKVENGETPHDALVRELDEELGIRVTHATPWLTREHVYEHAHVRLHFFRVTAWTGELRNLHHDALAWQRVEAVDVTPLLPANAPILAALRLPPIYGITHAGDIGVDAQLARLEAALAGGLRLVQLREPELAPTQRSEFFRAAVDLCHRFSARVLVNGDAELARATRADGIHLPARQLMDLKTRPDFPLVGASCHTAAEIGQAAQLECNFAVVGPVLATASHPGAPALGWTGFAQLAEISPLPLYAIGGLAAADIARAQQAGAHGIAAIRSVWEE
jgi:8-oxo-dGTP diphosphatase